MNAISLATLYGQSGRVGGGQYTTNIRGGAEHENAVFGT